MESENNKKKKVDLTGHWFVYFGAELEEAKMEGSRILTLNGEFDLDTLLDNITDKIRASLPDYAKEVLNKSNQRIIIRAFNRIGPVLDLGGLAK